MLKYYRPLILVAAVLTVFANVEIIGKGADKMSPTKLNLLPSPKVKITTVYDNYLHSPGLETDWGFSCLVEAGDKNILFDTGADGQILLRNMDKLDIETKMINTVVLSHPHGDHTGGLSRFLERNSGVTVYSPASFPSSFTDSIERTGAKCVSVDGAVEISGHVGVTGQLGDTIKEQSLVIASSAGIVVITGCAHPGILKIVKETKSLTGENIYLVMGGFHLGGESEEGLRDIVEGLIDMDVKKVAPCHCSGKNTRLFFERAFKSNYIDNGVGKIIEI